MKPLKLKPVFKDYIWGGEKLRTIYKKETDLSPVAESWELSCHKDGCSTISGGEYDGKTLNEFIKENPEVLGTNIKNGELPILIKLIDSADNLSVQVHPNDKQAKMWEGQNGKTEMWYVMDAEKDARIIYGVREDITKEELAASIKENRVEELLNSVSSKKGDVFFVEAGTLHGIGKGNLICEIQQNSNVTYRLYDYQRVGKDGKPRELHIEKGVEAANCSKIANREIRFLDDETRLLAECEYFIVKEVTLKGEKEFIADEKSYHALVVTDGSLKMVYENGELPLNAGETVFIPANMGKYTLFGNATVLITTTP